LIQNRVSIRALVKSDADGALLLYKELTFGPPADDAGGFFRVLDHPGTQVFGVFVADQLASMVTLHLLPNVLWGARPYALIENVVTARAYQKQGLGRKAMQAAMDAAWDAQAYKIMLMTGQKRGAKGFYEALGFSSEDKFAMVIRRD
jgi:GNAT superfamily N-acetyltransferase